MDIRDSQRIKEIRDNTRAMAEAFSSIASTLADALSSIPSTLADALELYISTRTETQTETQNSNLTFKTLEYCDICDHKGCEECIANALDEHCMPSQFNKQIEDECAKEYEELGLKELKELIEADRKTENSSEKPNNCEDEPQIYGNEHNCIMTLFGDCSYAETGCGSCEVVEKVRKALDKYELKTEPTISKMEQVDEPQTMYYPQVDGITPSVIVQKGEPQTDCAWK